MFSSAFQNNAFQYNAFQLYRGNAKSEYNAFQADAFQYNSFQMLRGTDYEIMYGRKTSGAGRILLKDLERKNRLKNLMFLIASLEDEL